MLHYVLVQRRTNLCHVPGCSWMPVGLSHVRGSGEGASRDSKLLVLTGMMRKLKANIGKHRFTY